MCVHKKTTNAKAACGRNFTTPRKPCQVFFQTFFKKFSPIPIPAICQVFFKKKHKKSAFGGKFYTRVYGLSSIFSNFTKKSKNLLIPESIGKFYEFLHKNEILPLELLIFCPILSNFFTCQGFFDSFFL